mgnify:CR=1 FL=1
MPEASLHVLEAIVAREVGEVELSDVARSLVAEGHALGSSESGGDSVTLAAGRVVAALSSAEVNVSSSLHGASVLAEVHSLERVSGVASVATLGQARVGEVSLLAASHELLIGSGGLRVLILSGCSLLLNLESARGSSTGAHTGTTVVATGVSSSASSRAYGRWRGRGTASSTHSRSEAGRGHLHESESSEGGSEHEG